MPREFDVDESTSPCDLLAAAQARSDEKAGPARLFRPSWRSLRLLLAGVTLALALSVLGWAAWTWAVTPVTITGAGHLAR